VCSESFPSPDGKRQFARGWLSVEDGRYVVRPVGGQSSHLVNDLAHANALVVVPEQVTEVPQGGTVTSYGPPASHHLRWLASANCLLEIDEDTTRIAAGTEVTIWYVSGC
jgi:molybdopterin biosynthesis enzyme